MGLLLKKLGTGCLKIAALYFAMWLITHVSWKYTAIAAFLYFYAFWLIEESEKQRLAPAPPIDVSQLSPLAYEDYCAVLLKEAGWRVRTTPRQDQGVDVVATLRGTTVAIQCKLYKNAVGNRAVQEVFAGRLHYGAHIAVVVSTASYTRSARELARSTNVLLLHHDQLASLETLAHIR